jgi:chaperonin GroES
MFKLATKLRLADCIESPNIGEDLSASDLDRIGHWASEGFSADLASRSEWELRMRDAMKLALQLREEKTFPWPGASNVKLPLITISALSFHSRIYPALVQEPDIVKCLAFGKDDTGELASTAQLISEHMSWQVFEEDESWEADMDKLFLVESILGCAFKKSYFDRTLKHNVSELVLPSDLVVNYWTKSLATAPRVTHIRYLSSNEILEKERQGLYTTYESQYTTQRPQLLGPLAQVRDQLQGTSPENEDCDHPIIVLEQCCWLDLDQDGYKEPYVVTFRHDNSKVLRIKAAFFEDSIQRNAKREVVNISPEPVYTKYEFVPSPDGGFYSLGFGVFLGPLSKSVDASINQLIDAGTMKNAGGGFLGRGVRVKGGEYTFRPGEWKRVDSTGEDLGKSIFPLPVGEPSPTLFQLLSLLISYGERVAGSTETTAGENPGQNTKVGTMDQMVEQGLQVFSGIYKRNRRAMRDEFRILFRLNHLYLNETNEYERDGEAKKILQSAYALPPTSIRPAADPNYMSDGQRQRQAMMVKGASAQSPLYNPLEVERWFLRTMKVPGIDKLLVKEVPQSPPPIQIQVEQMRLQAKMAELEAEKAQAAVDSKMRILELMAEAELGQAKILNLQAQAMLFIEQAGTAKMDEEIALINAQIGAAKIQHEGLLRAIEVLSKIHSNDKEKGHNAGRRTIERVAKASNNGGAVPGIGGPAGGDVGSVGSGLLQ